MQSSCDKIFEILLKSASVCRQLPGLFIFGNLCQDIPKLHFDGLASVGHVFAIYVFVTWDCLPWWWRISGSLRRLCGTFVGSTESEYGFFATLQFVLSNRCYTLSSAPFIDISRAKASTSSTLTPNNSANALPGSIVSN